MKNLMFFALMFSALTETQSQIVLGILAVVAAFLIFSVVNMFRRINDLERVVFDSSEKTSKLKETLDSVTEVSE